MSIAPDDDDIELTPIKSTLADKLATTEDNISKMLEAYENASRYVKYLQARQRMVICLSVAERKLSARDAELLIYLLLGETVARKSESPPSPFGAALQGAYEEGFDD
ncbi:MAG: hypothetical protein LBD72_03330 [Puniceicoccales bacterium]|jgi:hypothetical protein|nr:hypothetical protein [Puniceicoccales bacterium]